MKKVLLATILGCSLLAGTSCAPKYSSASAQAVSTLSCEQIQKELGQLKAIRAEAEGKSGFSKENVLLYIFFFPGAVVNELDNREVMNKIDARTRELVDEQAKKSCK